MRHQRVSNRFAKAIFDLAMEKGQVDIVKKDMQLIQKIVSENRELRLMLKSPIIKGDSKASVFKKLFEKELSQLTYLFLELIIKKHREFCISEICNEFIKLFGLLKGEKIATVTSVIPLTENEKKEIINYFKTVLSTDLSLIEKIDNSLIGGFIVKIDDMVYDTSVSGKLSSVKKQFIQQKKV